MKKLSKLFFILLLLFYTRSFSIEKRVITLAPNLTEIIYFLGLEKHLIANTIYCNYPDDAKKLPKIGDLWNFDVEKIVEYNPDFVLASYSGNSKTQVERLISLGIKVYTIKEEKVNDILSNIAFIGKLFNVDTKEKINFLSSKISNLRQPTKKKKVLFLLSIRPYYTVSKNTFIGDMLNIAGFENVIDTKVRYPLISEEEFAKLDFDTVLISDKFKNEEEFLKKNLIEFGKNPKIYFIQEDLFSRPGPRIFDLIVELNQIEK
jgi:iron complex transport system substrate-binding protein